MIKKKTLLTALAAAGLAFTAISAQAGGTTTVYVNLGLASDFRSGNYSSINNVDISSILKLTYGNGWASRTDLYWGIVALATPVYSAAVTNGDTGQTIYVSKARAAGGLDGTANSSAWAITGVGSSTTRTSTANLISAMQANSVVGNVGAGYPAATQDGTDTSAGTQANSAVTWDKYNSVGTLTSSGGTASGKSFTNFTSTSGTIGLGIEQAFGSTQTAGGQSVVGALDIYRIAGSNLSSGGTGAYVETITLNSSGQISAVPEPSTYALFGLGAGAIIVVAYRRRVQQA